MRKLMTLAVALGGLLLTTALFAQQDNRTASQRTADGVNTAADTLTGSSTRPSNLAPDAEDIRESIKEVTQAALTKGGLDDLIERLVDADRNRLGKDGFSEKEHPELDGLIAQIQKDWKAHYNEDFKIANKEVVYNSMFASIIQSEIPSYKDAQLAADRPVDPNQAPRPTDSQKVGGGDTNREPGRNIATVNIAAGHSLPMLMVPMIHEVPDNWKIDAPDSLTVQQLHDNLMKHLTMVKDMKNQWPADKNEAYRAVTHHVLAAVLNSDAQGSMNNMRNTMPNTVNPNSPPNTNNPGGTNVNRP